MYVRRPSRRYDTLFPIGPSTDSRDDARPTEPAIRISSRAPSRVAMSIAPDSDPMAMPSPPDPASIVARSTTSALIAERKPPRWKALKSRTPSSSTGVPSLVPPRMNGTDV